MTGRKNEVFFLSPIFLTARVRLFHGVKRNEQKRKTGIYSRRTERAERQQKRPPRRTAFFCPSFFARLFFARPKTAVARRATPYGEWKEKIVLKRIKE